jgi:hypothetical protein
MTFVDPLNLKEFTPALVRAALIHDINFARILLSNGANPNLGFHGIHNCMRSALSCGKIVQLAMDPRFLKMSQLLLEYGADIGLAFPV